MTPALPNTSRLDNAVGNKTLQRSICLLVGLFSIAIFLKNAWVAEDAFILLRSVDQFLHGNGFRWNPHERTQVYTSPLWYLLVIASTAFCKTLYLNLISLSLLLHAALLAVMALVLRHAWRWSAAVLLLTVSQAFFDFTASGLEYPLVYLLLATFTLLYLREQHVTDRHWLALCGGLALITRHDLLFVLTPMLLHLAWVYCRALTGRQLFALACLFAGPLTCWTLFSLLYYGFPFPNTAYAKLAIPGLPQTDRLKRGLIYLEVSLKVDPVTPFVIGIAMLKGLTDRNTTGRFVAAGLVLAFAYITSIGADYMIGRFYAPLYMVAVALLVTRSWRDLFIARWTAWPLALGIGYMLYYLIDCNVGAIATTIDQHHWPVPTEGQVTNTLILCGLLVLLSCFLWQQSRKVATTLLMLMLSYSTQQYDSPWQTGYADWGKTSDSDMWWMINTTSRERYWIYRWTSLYAWAHRDPTKIFPEHDWCHDGEVAPKVSRLWVSGMTGYCLPIDYIGIDFNGLVDPLMARMPKQPGSAWASGGATRLIPDGYEASLLTGQNQLPDADLARYYDKLGILTRSDKLFSVERLKTIVLFNLGAYEGWRQAYIERLLAHFPVPADPVEEQSAPRY